MKDDTQEKEAPTSNCSQKEKPKPAFGEKRFTSFLRGHEKTLTPKDTVGWLRGGGGKEERGVEEDFSYPWEKKGRRRSQTPKKQKNATIVGDEK